MIFPSKRDLWLVLLLNTTVVVQLVAGAILLFVNPVRFAGLLMIVSAGFIVWLMRSTYYDLGETELKIFSGPFRWKVSLAEIHEITPTHNMLSSPALSLDRLWITYRPAGAKRAIMVSPIDKEAFIKAVAERAPSLEVQGDRARLRATNQLSTGQRS